MSLRRKIAGMLRALADQVDDAPWLTPGEIDRRVQARMDLLPLRRLSSKTGTYQYLDPVTGVWRADLP